VLITSDLSLDKHVYAVSDKYSPRLCMHLSPQVSTTATLLHE